MTSTPVYYLVTRYDGDNTRIKDQIHWGSMYVHTTPEAAYNSIVKWYNERKEEWEEDEEERQFDKDYVWQLTLEEYTRKPGGMCVVLEHYHSGHCSESWVINKVKVIE